jgi:GT2 family glycosyltransferase
MENCLVSIVIINYNGENILKDCVESTLRQSHNPKEIIVIDNKSSDKSLEILTPYEKKLKIIKADKNLGCPGARNLALKYCQGKYIAFLDDDGRAEKNWIKHGIKKMEQDPKIGAIAPLVLFENKKEIVNGIGGFINENGYGKDYFYNQPLKKIKKIPSRALWPMGCGMIIRSDIFQKNKFDDILFNYYDDTDMGIKIWCSGYSVATEPTSLVYHLFSQSNKHNKNKDYLCERNRIYIFLKYLPSKNLWNWIRKEISRETKTNQKRTYAKIWLWNIKNLPKIISHRMNYNAKNIFPILNI